MRQPFPVLVMTGRVCAAVALLLALIGPLLANTGATTAPPPTPAQPAVSISAPIPPAVSAPPTSPQDDVTPPKETAPTPAELKVFGRDLFSTPDGTNPFEPNLDAPVPADYVLGTGDKLSVVCWNGSTEYERSDVAITANGELYLKLIGNLPLAQKTLAQAEQELRNRYARYYAKFNLTVQVVGRRTIPVFVMGEVLKPNKYMLSSLSTVFTALFAAGGPTNIGSLRTIQLVRGQRTIALIDLYAYLLNGQTVDLPLKAGDTIFVPLAGKVVAVGGEVRRPAKYELQEKDTLGDALAIAGGTKATSVERLRLSRIDATRERKVLALTLPTDARFPLKDGDEIMVNPVLTRVENAVVLEGAVFRPGPYPIEKAPTVSALITLAQGTSLDAYLEQAIITRQEANGTQRQIPVKLRAVLDGSMVDNIALQSGDVLRVFRRGELPELLDIVSAEGEVIHPSAYPYQPGMRIADLIRLAFGTTTKAYLPQVQIRRYPPAGEPEMVTVNLAKALAGDQKENVLLQPRDRVIIHSTANINDQVVSVEGEVIRPGSFPFFEGMKISDALLISGGLKADIALDDALLVRLNERTFADELLRISLRGVLAHDPTQDVALKNKDRLVIYPLSQVEAARTVRIEGAVAAPGSYNFIGDMRVSHLIFLAKGLQVNAYTQRADLYRLLPDNTTEVIPVDLEQASTGALTGSNPLLQPRDRLVISTREALEETKTVKVDGFVRKPGSYPLTVGMKLSDVLHLVGGLKPEAEPTVYLFRLSGERVLSQPYPITFDERGQPKLAVDPLLQTNDLVSVRGNAMYVSTTETVQVGGEVLYPGTYPVYDGTRQKPKTLYDVLTQSGGLLTDAYPAGIILYRAQGAIHTERAQQELARTMRDLDRSVGLLPGAKPPLPTESSSGTTLGHPVPAANAGATTAPATINAAASAELAKAQTVTSISRSLAQVFSSDQSRTIVLVVPPRSMEEQQFSLSIPVDAEPLLRSKGQKGNLTLEADDIIYIPKRPTTVTLLGGVINNGAVVYEEGKTLNSYIDAVGGLAPDGDIKRTIVMRMNGLVVPLKQARTINPGDIIIVPTKHILHLIHTSGPFERALRTISEAALSFLPFSKR